MLFFPIIGDILKYNKVRKGFGLCSRVFSDIQANRRFGKMAEEIITKKLKTHFSDAVVAEQITGRFKDGSKVVFDNVIVKDGKVLLINETKAGGQDYLLSKKGFLKRERVSPFVEINLGDWE